MLDRRISQKRLSSSAFLTEAGLAAFLAGADILSVFGIVLRTRLELTEKFGYRESSLDAVEVSSEDPLLELQPKVDGVEDEDEDDVEEKHEGWFVTIPLFKNPLVRYKCENLELTKNNSDNWRSQCAWSLTR